jgi:MFS family permease
MSYAYPELAANYRFLSGLAVLLPTAIIGIFMGRITDNTNRVKLIGIASILWSLTTFLSGEIDSFETFAGMRVLLGVFTAACIPPAVSLIRDYFPPAYRSQANSVFLASDYVGCCISSLSFFILWRKMSSCAPCRIGSLK